LNKSVGLDVEVKILGQGAHYTGWSLVLTLALQEINLMWDERLIVIADYRDVLLNLNTGQDLSADSFAALLEEKFLNITRSNPKAVLLSSEPQCCVAACGDLRPGSAIAADGSRTAFFCESSKSCVDRGYAEEWKRKQEDLADTVGAGRHKYKYLNAGLLAGRVNHIKELLYSLMPFRESEDNQALLTEKFLRRPDMSCLELLHTLDATSRSLETGDIRYCKRRRNQDHYSCISPVRTCHACLARVPLFMARDGTSCHICCGV